ncbi:hypothetical protein [Colwellia sp. E150_009]
MEHLKAAKKQWTKYLLLAFAAISPQAFSANYITALTVDNNVAVFTTQDDKTHIATCASAENQQKWSVNANGEDGLHTLIKIANGRGEPVEVMTADNCDLASGIEQASNVNIVYRQIDEQQTPVDAVISSALNFVARADIVLAEDVVLNGAGDGVEFGLSLNNGAVNWQDGVLSGEQYLHDFEQLVAGNYALTTKVTSGSEVVEQIAHFTVTDDILVDDFPAGLIEHGDFEAGNDFIAENANVSMLYETESPLVGQQSLKGSVNDWDDISYTHTDFSASGTHLVNVNLSGLIHTTRQMRVTVRVSYVGGSWSDSSSGFQLTSTSAELIPLALDVAIDPLREVSNIKLTIAGDSDQATPTEFVLDNVQLQVTPEIKGNVYEVNGELFIKVADDTYLKLTDNSDGSWSQTALDAAEWKRLIAGVSASTNYTIEFGEFSGDALEDFRITSEDGLTEINFSQTEGGYEYQPKKTIIEYQYNALGRLIKVIDTENGDRAYEYDKAGNRITAGSKQND